MACFKEKSDGAKRYIPDETFSKLREAQVPLADGVSIGEVVQRLSAIQQQDVGRNETPERFAGGSEAQCRRSAIAGGDATGDAQRVPLAKVALAVIEDVIPSAHLAIFRSNICVRQVVP